MEETRTSQFHSRPALMKGKKTADEKEREAPVGNGPSLPVARRGELARTPPLIAEGRELLRERHE
jgi:hypothetical protein